MIGRVGAIGEEEVEVINAVGSELLRIVGGLVQPNDWIRLLNEERPLPDDEGDVPGLEVRDEEGGRQTPRPGRTSVARALRT